MAPVTLSVLIPAHNESANLPGLLDEIAQALADHDHEVIVVDDGSDDDSWTVLVSRANRQPTLRPLRHHSSAGQSTALWQAARHARGEWLATLDGDGQNDPADIPALLQVAIAERADLVGGHRVRRQDSSLKLFSSKVANAVRARLLGDGYPDSGCGIKVIRRAAFASLPYFDHMHRFLPALITSQGGRCLARPVHHRPRGQGASHYGLGNRLWVGIVDMLGVMWLQRRSRLPVDCRCVDNALDLPRVSDSTALPSHFIATQATNDQSVPAVPTLEPMR
ncbi:MULTISPECIES: glycosyltransferase family 2 protein [Halomonas]|uniref:glycosyltransferase family 2 protein n=1 Tax=Halomonas TaxID=2745 RepID=UPI001C983B24|nr:MULTISPECIES: glycosyltransferase family 2 protein [Halomonas]MED5296423.1 glycosyltransferase family 2 protein [Pseudomonadota bacterium]MBY5929992.1 glycosyltransferase family 2 protein [Halomonas sp. DP8Y7-3]MBY5985688.1 glycosyltransferase family 2 protein [Halomonas sp. DP5Y7-2]MBY6030127.1 glycosyltransferase family 2 protein [Halomonas sp. DP8Y7-1]MBY6209738.1 glycosyltransferase family 2 protein [Halomonas sp. DP3Y7-2]